MIDCHQNKQWFKCVAKYLWTMTWNISTLTVLLGKHVVLLGISVVSVRISIPCRDVHCLVNKCCISVHYFIVRRTHCLWLKCFVVEFDDSWNPSTFIFSPALLNNSATDSRYVWTLVTCHWSRVTSHVSIVLRWRCKYFSLIGFIGERACDALWLTRRTRYPELIGFGFGSEQH